MADASEQLKQAIALIKAGDRTKAVALITNVLKTDKSNVNAWFLLANALTDRDKQIKALENALKIQPSNSRASTMLAKLRAAGTPDPEPTGASAQPAATADRDPFDDDADDADDDGYYDDDDEYYDDDDDEFYDDDDFEGDPFDEDDDLEAVDPRLREAVELIELGDKRGAIKLAREVMQEDRQNVDAYWVYANAEDNADRKLKALQRVVALNPEHDEAQTWIEELEAANNPDALFADIDDDGIDPFAGISGSSSGDDFEFADDNQSSRSRKKQPSGSRIPLLFEIVTFLLMAGVAAGGYFGLRSINGAGTVFAGDAALGASAGDSFSSGFDSSFDSDFDSFGFDDFYYGDCTAGAGKSVVNAGSITPGTPVSGTLQPGQSQNWTFQGTAGTNLNITVTGDADLDGYLELLDSGGNGLLSVDDSVGFMPGLSNYTLPVSGQYTLAFCGFGSTDQGNYTITLSLN